MMIWIHILPFVTTLINTIISRMVFLPFHFVYKAGFNVVYAALNYIGTIMYGHPLYSFLTWQSSLSLIVVFVLSIVDVILYAAVYLIIRSTKQKPSQTEDFKKCT